MGKLNDFLGSNVGGLVQGAAAQGISMLGQNARSKKAHERNLEYMDIQNQNQQGLNTQQYGYQRQLNQMGHDLQYDMWNKTNYKAQVEHMKKAGLNPALMYGTPGQGGSTGSQGGGSAQGGSASGSQAPAIQPMDMQNLLMGAQLEKLKAEADLTEAKAENEAGGVKSNLQADYEQKLINLEVTGQTKEHAKRKIRDEAVGEGVKNKLNKEKIELTKEQTTHIEHKVYQEWAKVGFKGLDTILDILPKKVAKHIKNAKTGKTSNVGTHKNKTFDDHVKSRMNINPDYKGK